MNEAPNCAAPPPVLVVDDDYAARSLLARVLRDEGYGVETFASGASALERLLAGPQPSVIVLDLMMSQMTGWEVLEQIDQNRELASLPVIVVSAVPEAVLESAAVGRVFLRKPFGIDALIRAVERCCRPMIRAHTESTPGSTTSPGCSVSIAEGAVSIALQLSRAMDDLDRQADALCGVAAAVTVATGIDPDETGRAAATFRESRRRLTRSLDAVDDLLSRIVGPSGDPRLKH